MSENTKVTVTKCCVVYNLDAEKESSEWREGFWPHKVQLYGSLSYLEYPIII